MASGNTLLIFTPGHNVPTATNYATLDTRNIHDVLDFDDTTTEAAVFGDVMPQQYGGGGITVYVHYSLTSATTGDVDIDVSWERIGDGVLDIDADSFAAVNSTDGTTVPGTSGFVDVTTVAFTDGADMDSVAAGEAFRLKVQFASTGTATGDIELHKVEIRET
jgi:hypothetical protein